MPDDYSPFSGGIPGKRRGSTSENISSFIIILLCKNGFLNKHRQRHGKAIMLSFLFPKAKPTIDEAKTVDHKIEIFRQQIAVPEKKIILRRLAESCSRQGMLALEVGSWCGDSAVEIGAIVNSYGGKLFCVDWWRGNIGTHLEGAAKQVDIYTEFWNRIVAEGLDDTVIPIRGRSDDVARALADKVFDFVYIDGDHRYEQAKRDICNYSSFVKDVGVLCGDDCEGRVNDFNLDFLNRGKDIDYHETVHCGVVLAVGEFFDQYSINYDIWSVRRSGTDWTPTNLKYDDIEPRRQSNPPLIESYKSHNLVRYGRNVYALPWSMGPVDITQEADRKREGIICSDSVAHVRDLIDNKL